jgi:hypothetical protein
MLTDAEARDNGATFMSSLAQPRICWRAPGLFLRNDAALSLEDELVVEPKGEA